MAAPHGPFGRLPRPPATDDPRQWGIWYDAIYRMLAGIPGLAWEAVDKTTARLSDLGIRPHSDLQDIKQASDTSTSTEVGKHVTDAQVKKYEDHRLITDGNPHGTDHDMLDGLADDDHAQYLLLGGRTPTQVAATPLIFGTATDNTTIEADGTIKFNGAATVWNDMQFSTAAGKVPAANAPVWEAFTTNTSSYSFGINDYIDLAANEPGHGWREGSDMSMHLHVTTKAANNTGGNVYAKFELWIGHATPNGTWAEITPLTAELTIPNGTPALHHFLLPMGTLSMPNNLIGTQIKPRVKRIAATGGTEYSGSIFITQLGAHEEDNQCGSHEIATK